MAKGRFLIDSNTFWMILGTSKISRFFGPVVDPWTPYLSWIYFKKYKKMWKRPWKILIFHIWEFDNLRIFQIPETLAFHFEFLKFRIPVFLIIINDEFLKIMKSRRWGISWHSFCRRNFSKILNMNLVSIKNMKRKSGKSKQFMYFQAM